MQRVREVVDARAHRGEFAFQPVALRRATPVVALEKDIEVNGVPHLDLARRMVDHRLVNDPDGRHDLEPLLERHDRVLVLHLEERLVGDHTSNQPVALLASALQDVQVTDVEHVPGAWDIAHHTVPISKCVHAEPPPMCGGDSPYPPQSAYARTIPQPSDRIQYCPFTLAMPSPPGPRHQTVTGRTLGPMVNSCRPRGDGPTAIGAAQPASTSWRR